ncbi:protein THEM6-like isoform X1 [Phymastichus coffea]|uniref:protein THEM6-like isoform X1 n=1 Tax=Phymastichus coffea TaxID=108790 RepID=UPI00273C9DB7|nr:protein THEM6-like isoform X1 [Phymastichus coffea]
MLDLLIFSCIILPYMLFDVNYFLRILFTIMWDRLFHRRRNIFEHTVHYGMCWTSDIDIFMRHMNNARYLRELDFARSSYYDRTGIFQHIKRQGGSVVQGATSIRYRQPITLLMAYKVTTKLIYWDDRSIYIEHEFVSLLDNFVRAIALSKQSVTDSNIHVTDIIHKIEPDAMKPMPTEELRLWVDSMEESSMRFRRMRDIIEETELDTIATDPFLPSCSS